MASFENSNICSDPSNFGLLKCQCINPPNSITNLARIALAPYYCWYSRCLDSKTLKTPEIIEGMKQCNTLTCSVSIDQIRISNLKITITNDCANKIFSNPNVNISLIPYVSILRIPVINYISLIYMISGSMMLISMLI